MLNWVQTLIEVIKYIWPFRIVHQWERGVYYVFGRCVGTVPAFVWPIIPYFCDVKPTSVVPGIISTPLLTITTKDGKGTVTFSAAATVRVADPRKAWNNVDTVAETVREMLAAVTAHELSLVDPGRLDGDSRRRLITSMIGWLNSEMDFMGCEVSALRFTNFVVNMRAYRFMTDTALLTE
jgi:regulator of protease activity HflC (stomatin/prohibitin superfamily)